MLGNKGEFVGCDILPSMILHIIIDEYWYK